MVAGMLAKLAGHSMFAAPGALDRLKMCADCRVIDLMKNECSIDSRWLTRQVRVASRASGRKTRPGRSSTRCSRASLPTRPTRHCSRRSQRRRRSRPTCGTGGDADGSPSAWDAAAQSQRHGRPGGCRDEYQTLFVGVGRSEVSLYASHYLASAVRVDRWPSSARRWHGWDSPGARKRTNSRTIYRSCSKPCGCWWRATASAAPAAIDVQQAFFDRHLSPRGRAIAALQYRLNALLPTTTVRVAEFTHCFLALERDSFAIE